MSTARRPSPQKKNAPADVAASREPVARGNQSTKSKVPANDNSVKAGLTDIVTREFHSLPIVELSFNSRQCWLLSSIEKAMEYADGSLARLIREEWSSEFHAGHHFDVVQGTELRALKRLLTESNSVSANSRAVTLLYVEGIDLAVIKTEKPIGRAVRAFLVDNVMQPLRETGRVDLRQKTRFTEVAEPMRLPPEIVSLIADFRAQLEETKKELSESRAEYIRLASAVTVARTHKSKAILDRVRSAARLTSKATKRSYKSCRFEVETAVRAAARYPRDAACSFEHAPDHVLDAAMIASEQELRRATSIHDAVTQAYLPMAGGAR